MKLRQAQIDLSALCHNYKIINRLASDSKVIAMIKSDGYGHGLLPVAKTLCDAESFGVSVIEEAVALRDDGINQRIIIMTGVQSEDELQLCIKKNIDIVVHSDFHLEMLKKIKVPNVISAWLKFDVGIHRLGFWNMVIVGHS